MHIKIFDYRQKSEEGFVLIAAIMAVMIMLAVSFFILTTSTQDIRISSRLVGEGKALTAAESGVQYLSTLTFNDLIAYTTNCKKVDLTDDPSTCYTVTTSIKTNKQTNASDGGCSDCSSFIYNTDVTGTDSDHSSAVTISIGTAPPSTPSGMNIISGTQAGE